MKEEGHELHQIVLDVAVGLLQAQDAWWKVGLVLVAPNHRVAVPGEEAKLEQILGDYCDLWGRGSQRGGARASLPPRPLAASHLSEDNGRHPEALAGPRDGQHGPQEDQHGQHEGDGRGGDHVVEDDDEVAEQL